MAEAVPALLILAVGTEMMDLWRVLACTLPVRHDKAGVSGKTMALL